MMRVILFFLCASNLFGAFPTDEDISLIGWLVNTTKKHTSNATPWVLPSMVGFDKMLEQQAQLLDKISKNPEALRLIQEINEGFKRQDGVYLRQMLVAAAKDRGEREALIRGMKFEKGVCWWPGLDLVEEDLWYGSAKVSFGKTQLKRDIDALEAILNDGCTAAPQWLVNLKVEDLDPYESYFKLFVELEPRTSDLISYALRYLQFSGGHSDLKQFLKQLQKLLIDISEKAKPRLKPEV